MRPRAPQEDKENPPGSEKIAANAFEALIGAIYIDQGPKAARGFVQRFVMDHHVDLGDALDLSNPKKVLNEVLRQRGKKAEFVLRTETARQTHNPTFVVDLVIDGDAVTEGAGASIKDAERDATRQLLEDFYLKFESELKLPSTADTGRAD